MLKALVNTKNPSFWILMHVILGISFALVNEFFILWLAAFVISSLGFLNKGSFTARRINAIYFIAYISSLNLLARMAKAYKYRIPWEMGKYVVFFGALYMMIVLNSRKGFIGFVLFSLLIPGMFFSSIGDVLFHDIVFNLLGPITLAIAVVSFYKVRITNHQFQQVLRFVLLPAISVLAYTIFRTPDFDNIEFTLGANFSTTGGYGSNQVSTILGVGLLIAFFFWVNKWKLTGDRRLDFILMAAFAFQGLLSFSRGGMIGSIIGIIVYVAVLKLSSEKNRIKYGLPTIGKFVIPALVGIVIVFQVADAITDGLLTHRYKGETTNTMLGKGEVNMNTLTTGRFQIFEEDMKIWQENFILGTGVGVSKILRDDNANSHVELSRLLAEHGLFGLGYFLILVYIGIKLLKNRTNAKYQGIFAALFALAIYTTFHAATRTYITPLFVGLALFNIVDIREPETSKS